MMKRTLNDFPGLKISQSWIWEPKADRVTYEGKDKAGNPVKIIYVRSQLSSQLDNVKNEIDPSFNNNHAGRKVAQTIRDEDGSPCSRRRVGAAFGPASL